MKKLEKQKSLPTQYYQQPDKIQSLEEFETKIELLETQNSLVLDKTKNNCDSKNELNYYYNNTLLSLQEIQDSFEEESLKSINDQDQLLQNHHDIYKKQKQGKNNKNLNNTVPEYLQQNNLDDSLFFTKEIISLQDLSSPSFRNNQNIFQQKQQLLQQQINQNQNNSNIIQDHQQKKSKKIKQGKFIQEEIFCTFNPQHLWKYGVWGVVTQLLFMMIIFERETTLFLLKIQIITVLIFVIMLYCWDIYFLRFATEKPEVTGDLEFEMTDKFYYKLKKNLKTNLVRSQIYFIKDCFWFTTNVSINLLICNYCRAVWYAVYFIKMWLGMVDHKYVHQKASYFFILNGSLYQFIKPDGNIVFTNLQLPINNYGNYGTNKNMEVQSFDEVIVDIDHENETVDKIMAKKTGSKNYDIIIDKYEIHTFLLIANVFSVHVSSHLMSNLISELDEIDFPQVNKAKIAVNGWNSAGIWITSLFVHGPQAAGLLVHNLNQGIPHYPVNENAPWVKKSQIQKLFKAILKDKQIDQIVKKYIKKSDNDQDRFSREKLLKVAIASNFAVHGIDHWMHDRFTMVYCYNDYLQWNNTKQTFFGGRWNCDITSSFNKPNGKLTEIIYNILRQQSPQFLAGFQWTIVQ